MKFESIDDLCQALVAELEQDPKGKGVAALLGAYANSCDDWHDFVTFDANCYTRNLIHRCGAYEMLLLGWEAGSESPIHNHAGQSCWMAVLDGDIEEVHFRQEGENEPMAEGRTTGLGRGEVAFIQDEIALHLIRPRAGRGISLHLYAQPIDECKIYDRMTGAESLVQVGYHTVRGEKCTESAGAIRAQYQ